MTVLNINTVVKSIPVTLSTVETGAGFAWASAVLAPLACPLLDGDWAPVLSVEEGGVCWGGGRLDAPLPPVGGVTPAEAGPFNFQIIWEDLYTTASYCIHTCPALSSISSRNPGERSNLYLLFNAEMLFKSRFPLNFASTIIYSTSKQ